MTRYWMLLVALLLPATLPAQRASYPKECTLTYIKAPTTPDSTKARCLADRARVDLYNATISYQKTDSLNRIALAKYQDAAVKDTAARAVYDSVMQKYKPKPPSNLAATVAIHSNGASVAVGATIQLYSEVKDAAGNVMQKPVAWSISDTTLANLSGAGLLTGKKAGTVTVLAKADTATGRRDYGVTGGVIPPPVDTSKPPIPPVDTTTPPPTGAIAVLPVNAEVSDAIPTTATSISVAAGADLQAAMNAAPCGSSLLLAPGATYLGNFTLPASKGANCWLVVRTQLMTFAAGRMTPSRAASLQLAKVWSPNYSAAISTQSGTARVFLGNLDIGFAPSVTSANMAINLINDATFLTLRGNYIHGHDLLDSRRAIVVNVRDVAITENWISDWHSNQGDNQALLGYDFTQRLRAQDNHLESSHEIVMFGGASALDSTRIPSDIIIRGNHITRPLAWKGKWQVKNLAETKNVKRDLMEGNVFENNWADAQTGFAFVWKPENQNGDNPWTTSSDITFRYNLVQCVGNVFNLSGKGSSSNPNITAARFTIYQNYVRQVNTGVCTAQGIPLQMLSGIIDVNFQNNTILNATNSNQLISFDGNPMVRFVFVNNAAYNGTYGAKGSGQGCGLSSINAFAPGATFTGNAIIGPGAGGSGCPYPPGNVFPSSIPAVAPPGADTSAVLARTAGVVVAP